MTTTDHIAERLGQARIDKLRLGKQIARLLRAGLQVDDPVIERLRDEQRAAQRAVLAAKDEFERGKGWKED